MFSWLLSVQDELRPTLRTMLSGVTPDLQFSWSPQLEAVVTTLYSTIGKDSRLLRAAMHIRMRIYPHSMEEDEAFLFRLCGGRFTASHRIFLHARGVEDVFHTDISTIVEVLRLWHAQLLARVDNPPPARFRRLMRELLWLCARRSARAALPADVVAWLLELRSALERYGFARAYLQHVGA